MPLAHDVDEITLSPNYARSAEDKASGQTARVADPCVAVIFGASGDLSKRKLSPAFYNLAKSRLLPDNFSIVGFARTALSQEQFQDLIRESICREHEMDADYESRICDWIVERVHYISGDYHDMHPFDVLQQTLTDLDTRRNTRGNYLFYLSTPPDLFLPIVMQLNAHGLAKEERGWRRFIVEKPFGHDLESAQELNRELLNILSEHQVYRIDHYLGKETVQNILIFRFSNSIFEPVWNRRYVDHVQITVGEEIGVEHRGSFYDKVGALRDMVPSHMMQLVSLTAMEPPRVFSGGCCSRRADQGSSRCSTACAGRCAEQRGSWSVRPGNHRRPTRASLSRRAIR